jgi:hypothetical protein
MKEPKRKLVGEHEVLAQRRQLDLYRRPSPEVEKLVRQMEYKLLRAKGLI